jgi:type IV fimbrial biogenesis protein FimT
MRPTGFSLIELLMAVAIVGIGLSLALPNVASKVETTRGHTVADSLHVALNQARANAISRSQVHGVCASSDGVRCARTSAWRHQVLVFADGNADGARQPNEVVDLVLDLESVAVFTTTGRPVARFGPDGAAFGANLTLSICTGAGRGERLVIANAGRIRRVSGTVISGC